MKVIFLDIDGVLNVMLGDFDKYGQMFHQNFVDNLKHIVDNVQDVKIVISSTWRVSGIDVMKQMWIDRNLPGEIIGVTPYLTTKSCRGDEIQIFLSCNHVDRYVIIDDDTDMLKDQMPYFVKTSDNYDHCDHIEGYGLTKECAEQCIQILNK